MIIIEFSSLDGEDLGRGEHLLDYSVNMKKEVWMRRELGKKVSWKGSQKKESFFLSQPSASCSVSTPSYHDYCGGSSGGSGGGGGGGDCWLNPVFIMSHQTFCHDLHLLLPPFSVCIWRTNVQSKKHDIFLYIPSKSTVDLL